MHSNRVSLLNQLRETIKSIKERDNLDTIPPEHSIFIPAQYLEGEQQEETDEFVKTARKIANTTEWGCKTTLETHKGKMKGVEFVFRFSKETDFDSLLNYIDKKLDEK